MTSETKAIWSGFWPRLIAYIADTLILGVVCYAIGMIGLDYFTGLGSGGRVVGLVLGVLYFGLTGSAAFGGRSLGMRILGLKVVSLDGKPLGLPIAFARALLLVGPLMLNNWFFDIKDPVLARIVGVICGTAVFGVLLAQIYLLLFNWPSRRLVHDLVTGSVVVRADATEIAPPKGHVHAIVAAVLVALGLAFSLTGMMAIKSVAPKLAAAIGPLQRVQAAVKALPDVRETTVLDNTSTVYSASGNTRTRILVVKVRLTKAPADPNQILARVGAATVKVYTFAPDQRLNVQIVYGFDLGFATYTTSQGAFYSTQCTTADVKCLN